MVYTKEDYIKDGKEIDYFKLLEKQFTKDFLNKYAYIKDKDNRFYYYNENKHEYYSMEENEKPFKFYNHYNKHKLKVHHYFMGTENQCIIDLLENLY